MPIVRGEAPLIIDINPGNESDGFEVELAT
jgi:hypothetical protein